MKITAKTTKMELANVLGANASLVQKADKGLFDRLSYASKVFKKDETKVTKKDLADLVRATMKALGDKFIEPVLAEETKEEPKAVEKTEKVEPKAENSVKKLGKKSSKKTEEPKAEETKEVESESEAPKKQKKTVQSKAVTLAEVFPDSFELEGQKYEIARDIANMGQLYDALEKEESIVFAMYWTKRHIKQFGYGVETLKAPKEFPMDLDLATCIHVSEECIVAYAVSAYTEACYMFTPNDIEETEGLRYAGGVEYQIYRMVE